MRIPRHHLVLLAVIMLFGAALRVFNLSSLGFWTDELCTLSEANGWGLELDKVPVGQKIVAPLPVCTRISGARPVGRIVAALARDDTHPPVYFFMVRAWECLFGDSEAAVRSLGVVCSVACIALLYVAASATVGAAAALLACLIMAVATPQIQYAQEARDYMPALMFSLAAVCALLWLAKKPNSSRALMLCAAVLAMVMTHYYAAGVALALAIHSLLTFRARQLYFANGAFTAAAVLFLLIWASRFHEQLPALRYGNPWLADEAAGHLARVFTNLAMMPVRWVGETNSTVEMAAGTLMWIGLPWLWFLRPDTRLWILWLVVPTAMVAATDIRMTTRQLALTRYAFFASPAMYVLLAAVAQRRKPATADSTESQHQHAFLHLARVAGLLLPFAAVLLAIASLNQAYVPAWKIDLRTPVERCAGRLAEPDGTLLIIGPDRIFDGIVFAAARHYLPRIPASIAVFQQVPSLPQLQELSTSKHVVVFWLGPISFHSQSIRGLTVEDSGKIPYFGTIAFGTLSARHE